MGLVYSGGFLVVIMRMMGISVRWIVPVVIINRGVFVGWFDSLLLGFLWMRVLLGVSMIGC